jgi:hypothetical protein
MSNFLRVFKNPLTVLGVVILAASGIRGQTNCGGQAQPASNAIPSSNPHSAAGNGKGAGDTKDIPSNASNRLTGRQAKENDSQPSDRTVSLSWKASTSPNVVGYYIYRQRDSDPRQQLNQTPIPGTSCIDNSVQNGHTYSYWARAVNSSGTVSVVDSNVAVATIQALGSHPQDAPSQGGTVPSRRPNR